MLDPERATRSLLQTAFSVPRRQRALQLEAGSCARAQAAKSAQIGAGELGRSSAREVCVEIETEPSKYPPGRFQKCSWQLGARSASHNYGSRVPATLDPEHPILITINMGIWFWY